MNKFLNYFSPLAAIFLMFITIGLCLQACTRVQDDIELADEVIQAEEKIYHAYEIRNCRNGASRIIKTNKPVKRSSVINDKK